MALIQRKNTVASSPGRITRSVVLLPSPKILRVDQWLNHARQGLHNFAPNDKGMWVVTLGLSLLLCWIYALGGFSFNKFETATHNTRLQSLNHVLTVVDVATQRKLVSFAISIVPMGATKRHNVTRTTVLTKAGPHSIYVTLRSSLAKNQFLSTKNPQPPIIRLVGDVLVPIPLMASTTSKESWTGTFFLPPMDGTLRLESQWTGRPCMISDDNTTLSTCSMQYSREVTFDFANGKDWKKNNNNLNDKPTRHHTKEPTWMDTSSLFPPTEKQFWIHINRLKHYPRPRVVAETHDPNNVALSPPQQQQYVWGDIDELQQPKQQQKVKWTTANTRQLTKEPSTYLALSSTILPFNQPWFDTFDQLSNYEIVCWMGGSSAELIHAAFMSLRGDLFPAQRPFKFHYHPMTNLEQPDLTWDDDLKEKFRKCKHVFLSLEDVYFMETSIGDALSAQEFQLRVTTFTQHLLKAFPDSTFPIYMVLTHLVLETPQQAQYETHHCYGANATLAPNMPLHSLVHPCHLVLRTMFTNPEKSKLFPAADQERIRLLDNADISQALIGTVGTQGHPRPVDVLGIIALRLYVLMGRQIKEWRDAGQIGQIDGLHRNDTIVWTEKNLVHYEWK